MSFTIVSVEEDRNVRDALVVTATDDKGATVATRVDAKVFDANDDVASKAAMAAALDAKAKQIAADEAQAALMALRLTKAVALTGQIVDVSVVTKAGP